MVALDLLREVLKDSVLRDKYNIPENELRKVSFDTASEYMIIEVLKEIINLKCQGVPDSQVYRSVKVKFGI